MTHEELERSALWFNLCNLGQMLKTDLTFDQSEVLHQLKQFDDKWVPYNVKKDSVNNRWGLPVTSNDGSVDSTAHLNSFEYMAKYHDTNLSESDFVHPTEVYHAVPSVAKIVDEFAPDIGRVHFLRIDQGGFFPPHRDFQGPAPEYFRLLAPFGKVDGPEHYGHIFDGKLVYPKPGNFYFLNVQHEHSVFSFVNSVYCVVLTVKLNRRTHDLILKHIE